MLTLIAAWEGHAARAVLQGVAVCQSGFGILCAASHCCWCLLQAGHISAMLTQRRRHAANAFAVAKRRAAQALLPKPSPADLAARLKVGRSPARLLSLSACALDSARSPHACAACPQPVLYSLVILRPPRTIELAHITWLVCNPILHSATTLHHMTIGETGAGAAGGRRGGAARGRGQAVRGGAGRGV